MGVERGFVEKVSRVERISIDVLKGCLKIMYGEGVCMYLDHLRECQWI